MLTSNHKYLSKNNKTSCHIEANVNPATSRKVELQESVYLLLKYILKHINKINI